LWVCSHLGCPAVGKEGQRCPKHDKPFEPMIYDAREIGLRDQKAPEAEVIDKVVDVAGKIHRAFRKP
jgi:hypothetical protein